MRAMMWFRESDLRCQDNTALYHASVESPAEGLLGLFIISPDVWQRHDMSDCRKEFILKHLASLSTELKHYNIPLIVLTSSPQNNEIKSVLSMVQKYSIKKLFYNQQFGVDEIKRDEQIQQFCTSNQVMIKNYTDHVVINPDEILSTSKTRLTIFTPFKKVWLSKLLQLIKNNTFQIYPLPKKQKIVFAQPTPINELTSLTHMPQHEASSWKIGENQALKTLDNFIEHKLKKYHEVRDFPAIDGTSKLSPYLASGILSPRQCIQNIIDVKHRGAETWLSELIWREYYHYVLYHFPRVSMNKPYKLNTEKIKWGNDSTLFEAWKNAQTGFPLIDAAMNQLNQTGWMHNRLRMLTASFLAKNLLIDWRKGEQYFMQKLIDGDLAANNGGWQWCASTGTDAVPYFRIFNPILQTKKFDPQLEFIKKYCPEFQTTSYPKPIIDLAESRKRALASFKIT